VKKDKANIKLAICHSVISDYVDIDREFFAPVVRLEDFILIRKCESIPTHDCGDGRASYDDYGRDG